MNQEAGLTNKQSEKAPNNIIQQKHIHASPQKKNLTLESLPYNARDWKILVMNFLVGIMGEFYLAFIEIHSKQKSKQLITKAENIMDIFPL